MPLSNIFESVRSPSPDGAVVLASLGLLLIFVELNRPGRILPASFGLLLLLLASGALFRFGLQTRSVLLLLAASGMALINLYRRLPLSLMLVSTAGWVFALRFAVRPRGSVFVHTPVALACGASLGILSAVLSRFAYRARRAKALN